MAARVDPRRWGPLERLERESSLRSAGCQCWGDIGSWGHVGDLAGVERTQQPRRFGHSHPVRRRLVADVVSQSNVGVRAGQHVLHKHNAAVDVRFKKRLAEQVGSVQVQLRSDQLADKRHVRARTCCVVAVRSMGGHRGGANLQQVGLLRGRSVADRRLLRVTTTQSRGRTGHGGFRRVSGIDLGDKWPRPNHKWQPGGDVALGEPLEDGAWAVRVHIKPFVRWLWFGGLMMGLGGVLAASDRRYRSKVRSSVREVLGLAGAKA